ncbi:hypothetical protein K4L44_06235 [Halosquirtibacter laminarini]|uniref:Uncharacterized protein n=1 Tax=Halosquirtibacter laminarini TaxID=3374600 RepID=A0AC61NIB3_9BACT|nr:hypothetical protein K4L44_06235 [Prolixibacteraceae bacterium]
MYKSNISVFSPTGNTKKVASFILDNIKTNTPANLDDLVIIGCPIYKGRVPVDYMNWLETHPFYNKSVIIVETFGNIHIDDALIELYDWCTQNNNTVLGVVAVASPHSYSTPQQPIATDRPTNEEWAELKAFALKMVNKIDLDVGQTPLAIPGNHPYRELLPTVAIEPKRDLLKCNDCRKCRRKCSVDNPSILELDGIEVKQCLMCGACIKTCPQDALSFTTTPMEPIINHLFTLSKEVQPSLFIS